MVIIYIRKIMEEKNIKVDDIVPYLSMSRRSVYNIFEGKKCPDIVELEEFARVLDVGIEDLYSSEYKTKK